MNSGEAVETFECFGSTCAAIVCGEGAAGDARQAAALARRALLRWHAQFSRFLADSELSRLNRDPRRAVPAGALVSRFAAVVHHAGSLSNGLVDATLLCDIERAGYTRDISEPLSLDVALELAPPRAPAAASRARSWEAVRGDLDRHVVRRPPGVVLDAGGLAKGLFADALAGLLSGHAAFAINCAGDLAIGGAEAGPRPVEVESPFDGSVLHTFELRAAGVATSGIGRRSWLDCDGRPAHHLLDPASGRPAYTGVVQATAIGASALEAEVRAKAAVLAGPASARGWLARGGVIVFDDRSHEVVAGAHELHAGQLIPFLPAGARR